MDKAPHLGRDPVHLVLFHHIGLQGLIAGGVVQKKCLHEMVLFRVDSLENDRKIIVRRFVNITLARLFRL